MGLEPVAFAGGASDKDIGEELHRDFFIAHPPAALASSASGIEGEGGGGKARALGLFSGGVEFADQIVNIKVKERGGAWGLRKWRLIDQKNVGDRVASREGADRGWIFDRTSHLVKEGFVNDFVDESAFAGAADSGNGDESAQRKGGG